MSRGEPRISGGSAIFIIIIAAIIICATIWLSSATVPAGHVGVYERFGVVKDQVYQPGFYIIDPLADIHPMSIKTQQYEYVNIQKTLTREGLEAFCDISVTWHLEPDKATDVYKTVSGDYFDTLITPAAMGILRDEVKRWSAEDIYTGQATQIQNDVQSRLTKELSSRGVVIESVWLRGTDFDPTVKAAISQKIKEKQDSEKMQYTIQIQKQQAEVAYINADGQARANERLSESLTPEILSMRYIDAISNNPNAIYVPMMGSGQGSGISMILPAATTVGKN